MKEDSLASVCSDSVDVWCMCHAAWDPVPYRAGIMHLHWVSTEFSLLTGLTSRSSAPSTMRMQGFSPNSIHVIGAAWL